MHQSEQINELVAALTSARATIESIKKDSHNPFFKSEYASFESIYKATEPSLTKNGLAVIQAPDYLDGKMVLVTRLIHTSGQWISSCAPLLPVKQDSQSIGAAITYMKRYSWAVLMGLPGTEVDDDGEAERMAGENKDKPQTISKEQVAELKSLINGDQVRMKNMLEWLKTSHSVGSIEQMPADAYEQLRPGLLAQKAAEQEVSKIEELAL